MLRVLEKELHKTIINGWRVHTEHKHYALLRVKLPTQRAEHCVCVSTLPSCSVQLRAPS